MKNIENTLSKVCGEKVEITIRGLREFTASFIGNNQDAVKKVNEFFNGKLKSFESEYDAECDLTVIYFTA
jgi:hypothetical protein